MLAKISQFILDDLIIRMFLYFHLLIRISLQNDNNFF
jgi:hypothetical protein